MKILSVNIEGSKHLQERVLPFLAREKADIVLLQEVYESDIPVLKEACGGHLVWEAMCTGETGMPRGIAMGSPQPLQDVRTRYYYKDATQPLRPVLRPHTNASALAAHRLPMLDALVAGVRICTVHHLWTEQGASTPEQQKITHDLLQLMDVGTPSILTGDFNAPRGRATWDILANALQDNIPADVMTSLDGTLHRAGQLPYMVDGIFSTPLVKVQNVQVHKGVSDHYGFTAEVTTL